MRTRAATALLTGVSSGLGYGLAAELLGQGWEVYGCSRRAGHPQGAVHRRIDLTDYARLPAELDRLTAAVGELDLVVLNAGILGRIQDLCDTTYHNFEQFAETGGRDEGLLGRITADAFLLLFKLSHHPFREQDAARKLLHRRCRRPASR